MNYGKIGKRIRRGCSEKAVNFIIEQEGLEVKGTSIEDGYAVIRYAHREEDDEKVGVYVYYNWEKENGISVIGKVVGVRSVYLDLGSVQDAEEDD